MRRRIILISLILGAPAISVTNEAKAQSLVDVCSGLSVDMPILDPVSEVSTGLLSGTLDPVLNGIVGDVNTNIQSVLSGENIGLTVLDEDGNLVGTADDCNLTADSVVVDQDEGIAMGGGTISALGGTGNPTASAAEINSIAIGNDASTDSTATSAIALGLRSTVSAVDGIAIGRDAAASAEGGVALGAGTVADRAGMNGAAEDFSGTAVASTAGAVSVGAVGAERQIINVAGGTADTDAVNVRQLRSVGDELAGALGGGTSFDAATGAFGAPSYEIGGATYNDVGSALSALDNLSGDLAREIADVRTEARSGIAAAMAMADAPMPSAPGKTSWAANIAVFKDEVASGFSVAHRFNTQNPLSMSASVAVTSRGIPGARAGFAGEF